MADEYTFAALTRRYLAHQGVPESRLMAITTSSSIIMTTWFPRLNDRPREQYAVIAMRTPAHRSLFGYGLALLGVIAATALCLSIRGYLGGAYASLVYLLVIVASATRFGVGPAILAAGLSFLLWNFFFIEPVGTFYVHNPREWLALGVFLVVGIVCGELAGRAREAGQLAVLREADRLKSAVLSSVSHDLRTPLASILASVSSLQENRARLEVESQQELLQSIHEGAARLDTLIGDLLDLSSIEAGVWRPGKELNHLTNVLGTVLERFDEPSNRRIQLDLPAELPPVQMDFVHIVQVLWNLLDNALKYSPPETPVLISALHSEAAVIVGVSDQGPGVPLEERERIFEKFYRARRQAESRRTGTGMGLAICKGIIEAHGGRIWADGSATRGATFRFTLPIHRETASAGTRP